jgi:hypothetical protein
VSHAVWAEFMPYRWVAGDLKRLRHYGLQLNLAIPPARLLEPDLKFLLQAAAAEGVPVGAWLLLEDAQGYWPNAENAPAFCALIERFLDWLDSEQLSVAEIIVDMETPLALSRLLKGRLIKGLQLEWQRWQHPQNRERFESAVSAFTGLVDTIHQAGLTAQVVTYPFIVHDAAAGNLAFQSFLQVPVTPVPWDRISLMVYRSSFQDLAPMRLSSWLVYSYLELAQKVLNVPVSAALGVIGSIGKITEGGFRDVDEIRADVAAARAAGVESIQLFSLDGMHQLGAPEDWLRLYTTLPGKPPARPGDLLLFQSLQRTHRLLSGLEASSERPRIRK